MNYPSIITMPLHESTSDLEKSLSENNENKKKDHICPIFICIICAGAGLLTGFLIYQSQLIEDGSL